MDIQDLVQDPKNRRKHTDRNVQMIRESLQRVGAARSIVIDENGTVLAGNATISAAQDVGLSKVQVVDAPGDTIVAVRRTGLDDGEKRALALYDNRTAELAEWDVEQLQTDFDNDKNLADFFSVSELEELGVQAPSFDIASTEDQGKLDEKRKVTCPNCNHEFTP